MADEISKDLTAGLGRRLLRRAASPGVIGTDLSARIQRRSFSGGAGLAAEIQRRWSPAAPPAWAHGSSLPYTGFGGSSGAVGAGSGGAGQAAAAKPAHTMPTARVVGAAAVSPAAQALSGLGSSLQRRHLGGRGSGSGVVQRRAIASSPPRKPSELPSLRPLTPDPSPIPSQPPGEGRALPLERRISPLPPSPGPGGEGLVQRRTSQAPTSAAAGGQPPGGSAPLLPSGVEMGPAIVRRGAGASVASSFTPGRPLPFERRMSSLPPSPGPEGAGLVQRRASQVPTGATAGGQPPEGSALLLPSRVEMGPVIIHRAAGRGPVQRESLPPASAGQLAVQRAAVPAPEAVGAPVEKITVARPASPAPASRESRISAIQRITARTEPPPIAGSAAGTGANLPLVQRRRLTAEKGGAGSVQLRRAAAAPVQRASSLAPGDGPAPAMGLSAAPSAELPLARPVPPAGQRGGGAGGIVVQRCGFEDSAEGNGVKETNPSPPKKPDNKEEPTAAGPDLEEVVERVMRRLTRSLTVESERHGGFRWHWPS